MRLMEEYSRNLNSSSLPQSLYPLLHLCALEAEVFPEFDVRDAFLPAPTCTPVYPRNRDVQGTCRLFDRH